MAHPELRKFIIIPILVNIVIGIALFAVFYHYVSLVTGWDWQFPPLLEFLEKILKKALWVLALTCFAATYILSFHVTTTTIAAPFYGLLAQKTEALLTGVRPTDEPLAQMIPRTFGREVQKLLYFAGRGLLVFLLIILLGTVVVLSPLAPLVGLIWTAWCMAIQYADYAADNHQTPFRRLRKKVRKPLYSSLGFGCAVMLATMTPVIIFIAPIAAVTGGTRLWVRELREH